MGQGKRSLAPGCQQGIERRNFLSRRAGDDNRALQLALVLLEVLDGLCGDANDGSMDGAVGWSGPARGFQSQPVDGRRGDLAACGTASPTVGDGPGFEVGIREAGLFELLHSPVAGFVQLLRAGEARANSVRQIGEICFELALVRLHLSDDFRVHFGDRIGLRGGRIGGFALGRLGGARRKRPAGHHRGELGGVVSPGGQDLRSLIQIVFPDFVKRVGLAVMSLVVLGERLNAIEAGHTSLIEGGVIGTERAAHARFE